MPQTREDYGLSPLELRVVAAIVDRSHASPQEVRDKIAAQSSRYVRTKNWRIILRRLHDQGYVGVHILNNEPRERRERYFATDAGLDALRKAADYHRFFAELTSRAIQNYKEWRGWERTS